MRRPHWWQIVVVVIARCVALAAEPTICADEACRCDPFTRVICNCTANHDEVTLRPDGAYRVPATATGIIVDGCARVYLLPDTIRDLVQLRLVEIRNVAHAVLDQRSLAWSPFPGHDETHPGVRIVIANTTVDEIASHAVQGRVDDITITDSSVNNLRPFAFSSLIGLNNVQLIDTVFNNIEIQAFKQFSSLNFIMRGGTVKTLPSRFLSDVEISNLFRMEGVTVDHVSSLTFLVSSPKRVLIDSNIIGTMDGDAFHVVSRGPITLRNNTVHTMRKGALFGFSVDLEVTSTLGRQELVVDNSTMTNVSPSSLMFNRTTLTLRVDGLNINVTCTCGLAEEWRDALNEHGGAVNCWYALEEHYMSLPTYVATRCGSFKQTFWIYVIVGVVLVVAVASIAIYLILRRENEKKKKVQIVMPDGKTYRETEFHIVVERAELLTTDL